MRIGVIGDAHFGARAFAATEGERRRSFLRFLKERAPGFQSLVILGDLFDFWFEYGAVLPSGFEDVLCGLREVARRMPVYFLPGNHDLWVGPGLERAVPGLRVVRRGLFLTLGTRRIWMVHGHELSRDWGARLVHAVLGNPVATALYRWVHPDLGIALARWVALMSRLREAEDAEVLRRKILSRAPEGYDLVVMGHYHLPFVGRRGQTTVLVPGDWLLHRIYAEITPYRLILWDFARDRQIAEFPYP